MPRRLVDRILAGEAKESLVPEVLNLGTPLLASQSLWMDISSPVISVDNVVEYFFKYDEWKAYKLTDLPCLAPPFPTFWLDSKRPEPSDIKIGRGITFSDIRKEMPPSWAAFVVGIKIDHDDPDRDDDSVKGLDVIHEMVMHHTQKNLRAMDIDDDAHWLIEVTLFYQHSGGAIVGPVGSELIPLDRLGVPLLNQFQISGSLGMRIPVASPSTDIAQLLYHELFSLLVIPGLFGVSLMHCRNVEQVVHEPSPKEQKSARKKMGRELQSYYVLAINPMSRRKVYVGEGGDGGNGGPGLGDGDPRRFHIVRGHFKDFREGPGLFGQHHGIWWWDYFARGDTEVGMVAKDYDVQAPDE